MSLFTRFSNTCPHGCRDDLGEKVHMTDTEWDENKTKYVCPVCGLIEWR